MGRIAKEGQKTTTICLQLLLLLFALRQRLHIVFYLVFSAEVFRTIRENGPLRTHDTSVNFGFVQNIYGRKYFGACVFEVYKNEGFVCEMSYILNAHRRLTRIRALLETLIRIV